MITTKTIIWRARCEHEDVRMVADGPREPMDAHWCRECFECLPWRRYEVSEARGWKVGVFADGLMTWAAWNLGLVSGEPGAVYGRRSDTEADADYLRFRYRSAQVVTRRVVRRTLRRVG